MRFVSLAAVAALACTHNATAQPKPDACRAQIPGSVGQLMAQKFPQHRLPLVADADPDVVQFEMSKGNNGCIVVAKGDFNGDKRTDFAVGLTPTTAKPPVVAVALSHGTTWDVSTVESWVDHAQRLYVERARPRLFKQFEGFDAAPQRGTNEREALRCRTDAVIVGATESTGIAYCHVNNQWLYVWISERLRALRDLRG